MQQLNRTPWSEAEQAFAFQQMGKMPLWQIAQHLGKSERAIALFLHRHRQDPRAIIHDNIMLRLLTVKFARPEFFTPTKKFFREVQINQKRFWSVYKGKQRLTQEEYVRLANYLQLDLKEVFESLQLSLFDKV